jgi:ATP-dependent Clp protease protease subunit
MARRATEKIELFFNQGLDVDARILKCFSYSDSSGDEAGVDWQLADTIITGLSVLETLDAEKPITLLINNHGGEDDHCRAIMAAIRNCKAPVHGLVLGRAESAAAWIFQSCDHRIMDPLSNLMFHMGSGTKNRHSKHIDDVFTEILLRRLRGKDPSYPKAKLVRQLHEDWYVYPTQALELGLADEILE